MKYYIKDYRGNRQETTQKNYFSIARRKNAHQTIGVQDGMIISRTLTFN